MAKLNTPAVKLGAQAGGIAAVLCVHAMENDRCVEFQYDGKTRIVEVHAIGTSTKDGSLVMRGFQVGGDASRPLPQWTLFTLSKITSMNSAQRISDAPRDGYTMGDKQMDSIVAQLDIR